MNINHASSFARPPGIQPEDEWLGDAVRDGLHRIFFFVVDHGGRLWVFPRGFMAKDCQVQTGIGWLHFGTHRVDITSLNYRRDLDDFMDGKVAVLVPRGIPLPPGLEAEVRRVEEISVNPIRSPEAPQKGGTP